jgi:hypothetical protein
VKAVDGRGAPLPPDVIHDRLAQEFGYIFKRDEPAQTYAQVWRRPELVTYVFWEDALRRWPQKPAKAGDETKAANLLAEHLKTDEHLAREEAFKICLKRFPNLTERGFRFRVWPKARETAGLAPVAPAGRKPTKRTP